MAYPGNYSSPTEARAARRGGRGFYRDKGVANPSRDKSGTEKRDEQRTPEDRETAALARQLVDLAEQFPRFKGSLFRLRHHVLVQVRSAEWKCAAVLKCLGSEPALIEEIMEETGLDKTSSAETLELLATNGKSEKVTRDGEAIRIRSDGKPAERVYWIRASARQTAVSKQQSAGGRP